MDAKNSEWIEKTEAKIREAFDLFDKEKADAIIQVTLFIFPCVHKEIISHL